MEKSITDVQKEALKCLSNSGKKLKGILNEAFKLNGVDKKDINKLTYSNALNIIKVANTKYGIMRAAERSK